MGKCEEHIHDTANIRICVSLCVVLSGAMWAYMYVCAPASVHECMHEHVLYISFMLVRHYLYQLR